MRGGKQRRQAANIPHCGVEIEQGVAPITATRDRPLLRRQVAGLKRGAEWLDPPRWDRTAQQEKTLVVQTTSIFGVEPADLRVQRMFALCHYFSVQIGDDTNRCNLTTFIAIIQMLLPTRLLSSEEKSFMPIIHITAADSIPLTQFASVAAPSALEGMEAPLLSTLEAYASTDRSLRVGTWEAAPGRFRRAVVDAEFSHFIAGHATFDGDDGRRYEFRAGDAAWFPPATKGTWTVHQALRKTYVVWRDGV